MSWRVVVVAVVAALAGTGPFIAAQTFGSWLDPYRGTAHRLMAAAQENDFAWQRLAELTDTYGARPAWSETLPTALTDATLIGTPGDVRTQVQHYIEAGVDHFLLWFLDAPDPTGMELFAHEVAPAFR